MVKKATASKEVEPVAEPAREGMPVFYRQPAVMDKERHAKASVTVQTNYEFARATNSLALNVAEFIEAGKSYPIVFTDHENPTPIAVLGLEKENYFVGKDGLWKADTYIPAYARQYPFIFFEQPDNQNFYLCIDEGAPHFNAKKTKDALPLFTDAGEPTELTQNALKFCGAYYQDHTLTRSFCAALKTHKLLTPTRWEAQLPTGKKLSLGQFQVIDEKALTALSDEVILDFHKKGWLPFIYLVMASASNWKRLVAHSEV